MIPSSSPIKLRGHHLICLHFFHGEGYNPEFVTNLSGIIKRALAGEEIAVQSGPDDVCEMCPHLKGGACSYDKEADYEIREMDKAALELLQVKIGARVKWSDMREIIRGIFSRWSGTYCRMCDWKNACGKDASFRGLSVNK
jgi:uncharacterized protein